ncbi:MAG TPA: gamma-butyrobetaine hydroxylase-like domain-containing protein [Candidatus Tectomicrobia bacterium]|nr:gamma-butyrobetaine hydroxylase-like domain-containing protein [Candidatus Tectomicrobia bacterium]
MSRLLPILGQGDPNRPRDIRLVGRYAVGVDWDDGHGSIYPFEQLRRACGCGACAALETLPAAAAWPREISRQPDGVRVTWADGHVSTYAHPALLALCACATCAGVH